MIRVFHPGSRIRMLTFYPSRIPDPGVKKAPDPGSGSATLKETLKKMVIHRFNIILKYQLTCISGSTLSCPF